MSTDELEVREVMRSELPELLRLYDALHPADKARPEDSALASLWESLLASDHHLYFGVFLDGSMLATCNLAIIPNLTRGCRPYGVIENVVTLEAYRRRGLGRAVLRHALEVAWKRDCYKVMLLTSRLNEETFRFYESVGFDRHAKQAFVARPRA